MRQNLTAINDTGNACIAVVIDPNEVNLVTGYLMTNLLDIKNMRY
jgi:hypothetical protein